MWERERDLVCLCVQLVLVGKTAAERRKEERTAVIRTRSTGSV